MYDLESSQVKFNGSYGTALLGELNEVVDKYVLPSQLSNNVGFGKKPEVLYNNIPVGTVKSYKAKERKVFFLIALDKDTKFKGVYWCKFKLNTLFSEKKGDKFVLDQIIVENIEINEPIHIKS